MERKKPKVVKVKINDLLNTSQAAILRRKQTTIPSTIASTETPPLKAKSARSLRLVTSNESQYRQLYKLTDQSASLMDDEDSGNGHRLILNPTKIRSIYGPRAQSRNAHTQYATPAEWAGRSKISKPQSKPLQTQGKTKTLAHQTQQGTRV